MSADLRNNGGSGDPPSRGAQAFPAAEHRQRFPEFPGQRMESGDLIVHPFRPARGSSIHERRVLAKDSVSDARAPFPATGGDLEGAPRCKGKSQDTTPIFLRYSCGGSTVAPGVPGVQWFSGSGHRLAEDQGRAPGDEERETRGVDLR